MAPYRFLSLVFWQSNEKPADKVIFLKRWKDFTTQLPLTAFILSRMVDTLYLELLHLPSSCDSGRKRPSIEARPEGKAGG
jgi:hypothetical protein